MAVTLTPNKFIYKTPDGGEGMMPLASLTKDLQEKFGYDPQAAQAADDTDQQKKARQQQLYQQANVQAQTQSAVSDVSLSIKAYAEKKMAR